ncbi:hypothetical protein SLS55_003451 [Diplodia seriata]|uniref:Xylanolytic transcriptional activator regulatory domain-containing protein n=1 Tax=Diplodia seriata TaxID=420778 RepID=A0ABR3CN18_9PEZI
MADARHTDEITPVVTAFHFRTHPYSTSILSGYISFPPSSLEAVSRGVSAHAARPVDPLVSFHCLVAVADPKVPGQSSWTESADQSDSSGINVGIFLFDARGEEHGRSQQGFKWAFDIPGAVDKTTVATSLKVVNELQGGNQHLVGVTNSYGNACLASDIDPEFVMRGKNWVEGVAKMDARLGPGTLFLLEVMPGDSFHATTGPEETAWPHSSACHVLQLLTGSHPDSSCPEELSEHALAMAPYIIKKSHSKADFFPNFLESINDRSAIFGVNYPKLQQIKKHYDPRARFHHDPDIQAQGTLFAQEAKRLLKEDVENICIANVQACILVANTCGANNEATSEALFFGIAIRMAQILSLPEASAVDTAIDQEVKRRVYWTLYMVDRWNSAGLGLTRQLPDALKYPMPVHELEFHQPHFRYHASLKPGLWAYFINLASIFGEIQDLHRRHVSGELEDAQFEEQAQGLAARLEQFAEGLPTELRLNVDNLRWHADQGIGRTFVALHLGFHHYSTLIHFQYLDIQLPRTPKQRLFASRCKHHANTYSDLLKLSTEIPNCDAVYNIVGHMTVVSSSVLLHILFFGEEDELPMTRQRLEQNFQVLIKLRSYWPSVHKMMDRLFTFQKACMWTADPNTHKIDKWMLKFLLQHAIAIEDKVENSAAPIPSISAVISVVSEISSERGRYATNALSMLRQ